jgi:hypothetical protein
MTKEWFPPTPTPEEMRGYQRGFEIGVAIYKSGYDERGKLIKRLIKFIENECSPACAGGYETAGTEESRRLDIECAKWDNKLKKFKKSSKETEYIKETRTS